MNQYILHNDQYNNNGYNFREKSKSQNMVEIYTSCNGYFSIFSFSFNLKFKTIKGPNPKNLSSLSRTDCICCLNKSECFCHVVAHLSVPFKKNRAGK